MTKQGVGALLLLAIILVVAFRVIYKPREHNKVRVDDDHFGIGIVDSHYDTALAFTTCDEVPIFVLLIVAFHANFRNQMG